MHFSVRSIVATVCAGVLLLLSLVTGLVLPDADISTDTPSAEVTPPSVDITYGSTDELTEPVLPDNTEDETAGDTTSEETTAEPLPDFGGATIKLLSELASSGRTSDIGFTSGIIKLRELYDLGTDIITTSNVKGALSVAVASGDKYDLVSVSAVTGGSLVSEGWLTDMTGDGVPRLQGINYSLSEDLSPNGGIYLAVSELTLSDISASYALRLPTADEYDDIYMTCLGMPLDAFRTSGRVMTLDELSRLSGSISFGAEAGAELALVESLGGRIFGRDDMGNITVSRPDEDYKKAYNAALRLFKEAEASALITVSRLSPVGEGTAYVQMPVMQAGDRAITPMSTQDLTVLAMAGGGAENETLEFWFSELTLTTSAAREAAMASLCSGGLDKAVLERRALDPERVYKFGGLGELYGDGLSSGLALDAVISADRLYSDRLKAAGVAINILISRLFEK